LEQQLHVTTPEDERRVVDAILQALAKYILDFDIDITYLRETKLQKIVFKTVEELDVPVTRSWYIRGCMVHPGGTVSGSVKLKDKIEKFVKNPGNLTINPDIYACFDGIQINKIVFTNRKKFLRDLYTTMEPARFRKEYIPNNELILSLEDLGNGVHDVSTTISENISKLYLGMQGDELFNGVSKKFYNFLDFTENTCIEAEGIVEDGAQFTSEHLAFFTDLSNVYYYNVWKEPASIISIKTAKGPCADKVVKQRQGYLPLVAREIEEHLNGLKQKAEKLNLSLSEGNIEKAYSKSCSRIGDSASKHLTEMWKIYAK
jgi:hypothetical protein